MTREETVELIEKIGPAMYLALRKITATYQCTYREAAEKLGQLSLTIAQVDGEDTEEGINLLEELLKKEADKYGGPLPSIEEVENEPEIENKYLVTRGGAVHKICSNTDEILRYFKFNHTNQYRVIYWLAGEKINQPANRFLSLI